MNISIIIITNDGSTVLRDSLPRILSQQYDAAFEVIVVRETLKGEVKDIVEPLIVQHQNLYSTYLPDTPQYVEGDEIEMLLGVKAAKYDDIIVVHPAFFPENDEWLKGIASLLEINSEYPVLIGSAHISERGFFARRRHRKVVKKLLKPWCKDNGLRFKDLILGKADSNDLVISFRRKDYLSDLPLRHIISTHCR